MNRRSSGRARGTRATIALLALCAGAPVALAQAGAGAGPLSVVPGKGSQTLRQGALEVATVEGRVSAPRALVFPGSRTVLYAWDQYGAGRPLGGFALSLDGGRS